MAVRILLQVLTITSMLSALGSIGLLVNAISSGPPAAVELALESLAACLAAAAGFAWAHEVLILLRQIADKP